MLKKLFNTTLLLCLLTVAASAQEFNCKVKVMRDKILNVDKEIFTNMERSVTEFLNTRKWTGEQYNPAEKIDCNILLNLTKVTDGDIFEGTLNIQSSRPVYNTSYTSPTINFIDREVRFKYSAFTPLQFDDNRVSGNDALSANLTAVLAYYMYLTLGLDYDSFELNGGNDYFKKAQNVVNNAPEQGKNITGWKAVEGNRNRYWIVDQLLSPRFKYFREYWYMLHRTALDNMYTKPEESRMMILDGLVKLAQMHRENPGSILMQFFFNAKGEEMMSIVAQVPKDKRLIYITMLQQMDVPNAQKYANLK
jgi:hypothetical protein